MTAVLDRSQADASERREVIVGKVALRPADVEVMTLEQAALLLQTSGEAVAELAESGELPARKVDGEWRFSRAAILAWLGRTST